MKIQKSKKQSTLYEQIYSATKQIPKGKVSTYGQIAKIVGCSPRVIGYAMHSVSFEDEVPWQRVVNSKGMISFPDGTEGYDEQTEILESEGILFNEKGKIDLKKFGWETAVDELKESF